MWPRCQTVASTNELSSGDTIAVKRTLFLEKPLFARGDLRKLFHTAWSSMLQRTAMPTPLDVKGTITQKVALIILLVVVAGLLLAFTPLRVIGYGLLAIGAAIYVFSSFRTLVQQLR